MRRATSCLIVLLAAAAASAQTAPAGQKPAAPAAPAAGSTPAATPPDNYTYNPEGRRDPFLNLLGAGSETRGPVRRGGAEGPAGLSVTEISVRGIVQSKGALVAMVQAPDRKTYLMRAGDKFVDGTIRSVTPQGLVIVQEVNDPLSLVKQREIRKLLHSIEDAKE